MFLSVVFSFLVSLVTALDFFFFFFFFFFFLFFFILFISSFYHSLLTLPSFNIFLFFQKTNTPPSRRLPMLRRAETLPA